MPRKQQQANGPFGEWLRSWRKSRRHTLGTFSAECGLAKSYLWQLEKNVGFNPSLDTLMALARATETPFTRVAILAAKQRFTTPTGARDE